MFVFAFDAVAPSHTELISGVAAANIDILILLLVILLCVAVGIVYACMIKKKSAPPSKEECAEKDEVEND